MQCHCKQTPDTPRRFPDYLDFPPGFISRLNIQIGEHVFSPFLGYGEADIFTRKAHQTKRVRYSVRSGTKDMISSMTSMATRKGMAARAMSSDRSSAMELAA